MSLYTNDLIHESSPYLLQHAHNPVNWVAWSDEAFERARLENKLVLVSIGYSACHWCHVMEHECFEDEEVATWMNRYFICIKVDREERPDVDQVYMTAVQLMTQKGGWPLNCFTLPDGRPVYGGTYFPKEHWIQALKSLEHVFREKPDEVLDYAEKLQQGIQQSELVEKPQPLVPFEESKLGELVLRWSHNFDRREGGSNRAPKFPLPNNHEFLLHYATRKASAMTEKTLEQVYLTLDKMAFGGIYDQVGGGFCRYSVDVLWKVPHFEKMLYDNAQLVSLYAKAYQQSKNPTYKAIVVQTLNWVEREMTTPEGAFYSALDADSEGEEGKFYVWKEAELQEILGADFSWVKDFYNVNQLGYWEAGNYILMRSRHDAEFARQLKLSPGEFENKIARINQILLNERSRRVRPGLDNKCLTSWNAMQLEAYVDAYFALGDETYLLAAIKNARWIEGHQLDDRLNLFHNYNQGKSSIEGFLEDYAQVISAFIKLYQVTFDEHWLELARKICDKTIYDFRDDESRMFWFTDRNSKLIARKMDLNDNVTPATNSVMCRNLLLLGAYFDKKSYTEDAQQMLMNVYNGMEHYGSGYSNWAMALLHFLDGLKQICITGKNWKENLREVTAHYLPESIFSGGTESELPLLQGKDLAKNRFYLCIGNNCSLPEETLEKFIKTIVP